MENHKTLHKPILNAWSNSLWFPSSRISSWSCCSSCIYWIYSICLFWRLFLPWRIVQNRWRFVIILGLGFMCRRIWGTWMQQVDLYWCLRLHSLHNDKLQSVNIQQFNSSTENTNSLAKQTSHNHSPAHKAQKHNTISYSHSSMFLKSISSLQSYDR